MVLPETNLLRFFIGALNQFRLFRNKRKEQLDECQVIGPSRIKFLGAPLGAKDPFCPPSDAHGCVYRVIAGEFIWLTFT